MTGGSGEVQSGSGANPMRDSGAVRSGTGPDSASVVGRSISGTSNDVVLSSERGVASDRILLGTTTVRSGPNRDLGLNMVEGMRTSFAAVNASGGIHGRRLELVVLNDGYEPERARANMVDLLEPKNTIHSNESSVYFARSAAISDVFSWHLKFLRFPTMCYAYCALLAPQAQTQENSVDMTEEC